MLSDELATADVDGDDYVDLIGSTAGSIQVRFNDRSAGFDASLERTAPLSPASSPALGRLDDDARIDLVTAVPYGLLVLKGAADRTLQPLAYAPYDIPPSHGTWMIPIDVPDLAPGQSILFLDHQPDALNASVFPIPFPGVGAVGGPTPDEPVELSDIARIPVADLDGDGYQEAVLAPGGAHSIVIVRAAEHPIADYKEFIAGASIETLDVGRTIDAGGGALVADLDADATLDLLLPMDGAVWSRRAGGSFAEETRFAGLSFPLVAADLNGDQAADFVTAEGVFLSTSGGASLDLKWSAPEPWTKAVTGDFDSDGRIDVAASGAYPRIDFVHAPAEAAMPRFTSIPDAPTWLLAGNFDGLGPDDILFGRPIAQDQDELAVLFGVTNGVPGPPVSIGRFPTLEHVEVGRFRAPNDPNFDAADDIAHSSVEHLATGTRPAGIALGSSNRTLYSPLLLQEDNDFPDIAHAALVGRFEVGDPPEEADIVAIAESPVTGALSWWTVEHRSGAAVRRTEIGGFPSNSLWRMGDVDGDGLDEIVGVRHGTGEGSVLVIDPDSSGAMKHEAAMPAADEEVRDVLVRDLDGDGAAELCLLRNDELTLAWGTPGAASFDVAPIALALLDEASLTVLQADTDRELELAVLGAAGIAIVDLQAGALVPRPERLPFPADAIALLRIASGDLDGDGLDDLLVAGSSEVRLLLAEPARGGTP